MVKAVASQYAKLFVVYKPHAPTNRRTTVTRLDLSTAARAKVPDILSRDPDTHTHTHARTHARTCTNEASKISNLGCTHCTCIWQDQSLEQEDVSQRKHSTCNPARTVMATVDYTGRITRVYAISAAIELDNSVRLLLCHAAVPGMGRGFRVGAVVELRCVCKDS